MNDNMEITQAQYMTSEGELACINATIDGMPMSVPLVEGNRHYDEIMLQAEAGTLTIQEAE